MIQQLISTSAPRCLNGNAGFGIVAQTAGMAPNVSQTANSLSAYSHRFPVGDARNPAVFLHALRRTGGVLRHIVSRISDAGNDYSGRTNRLAHHWIIEENDIGRLPCGPAALATKPIFVTEWKGSSKELPFHPDPFGAGVPADTRICTIWQRLTGDAGWAGAVAEQIEKGHPISILFTVSQNELRLQLLDEVFALLPESVRWRTTFSTFFMKSQEPAGAGREERIQVKFFLDGTDEARYAKQTPDTLLIDLRRPQALGPVPSSSKYVEVARTGEKAAELAPRQSPRSAAEPVSTPVPKGYCDTAHFGLELVVDVPKQDHELTETERMRLHRSKRENIHPLYWILPVVLVLVVLSGLTVWLFMGKSATEIAKANMEQKQAERAEAETGEKKKEGEKKNREETERIALEEKAKEESKNKEEAKKKAAEAEEREKSKKEEEIERTKAEDRIKREMPEKIKASLPNVWNGLALPVKNEDIELLDLSKLLGIEGVKDGEVKIGYVPFVRLNETKEGATARPLEFTQEGNSIAFHLLDRKDAEQAKKEKIASIYREKNALRFKWESALLKEKFYISNDWNRILNRILLGKLTVTISPISLTPIRREIALWQPVVNPTTFTETKIPTEENKAFALWQRPSGRGMDEASPKEKPFVFYKEDNVSLLLGFDNMQANGKNIDVKEEIQPFDETPSADKRMKICGFSPMFSYPSERTPLHVSVFPNDFKLEFKIRPDEKKIQETFLAPNEEKKRNNDEILRKIAERDSLKAERAKEKDEKKKSDLNNDIKRLDGEIGDKSKEKLEANNMELDIERKTIGSDRDMATKAGYSIPAFSIHLLRSDTKREDVAKGENQLLLLEVK